MRPLGVATAAENDRVLCRHHSGKVGVHRVVPAEETIWGLGNPVEGQQLAHNDLSHALHLRLVSMLLVDWSSRRNSSLRRAIALQCRALYLLPPFS